MSQNHVTILEVGPRDGLQNEKRVIPTAEKVTLIDLLSTAGFTRIEAVSFVSPKRVPQMADGDDVMAAITRAPTVRYAGLTPNLRGYERARAVGMEEISVFASASEGFSQSNLNCSISESLQRFQPVLDAARVDKVMVRSAISCVTDCPFDGPVSPAQVADVAGKLDELGVYEIALGDTIGAGKPETIGAMLDAVTQVIAPDRLAGHFHNTNGRALDNIDVALDFGLRVFDSAVGGLGGCPFAPGAAGNVATEAVLDHLTAKGFDTGLDANIVARAGRLAQTMREGAHV